ncbi:hypothetical protein BC827DRAFT_1224515 [Russula dissimulans]|nr:hypothetical protein BC827DRAFT_1224515 [Russula dissimulans]
MSHLTHPTHVLQSTQVTVQGEPSHDNLRRSTPIHILDDDSLLNIDDYRILNGGEWIRERWWYKLAQVCQRWRYLILGSASYLQLCLLCTFGTPIVDMLAHSPPLPLTLDYICSNNHDIGSEVEDEIILALQHRRRVRRIRLRMPMQNLRKLIPVIENEFPMLEFLNVEASTKDDGNLTVPHTFRAPHLRHLMVINFDFPLGSPLLATSISLVTLSLQRIDTSASFSPNDLIQRLSLMPRLETLGIGFHYHTLNVIERGLMDIPITSYATLPFLRWFGFGGSSAYLEVLLSCITTPILEKLQIMFSNQPTFSVSSLLQFMTATKNLKLSSANFDFDDTGVAVTVYPHAGAKMYALHMDVACEGLRRQVSSLAQIFTVLSPVLSAVECIALAHAPPDDDWLSRRDVEFDRPQWRELLGSFKNVNTLLVKDDLVWVVSRCLQLDEGEDPLERLPKLQELSYSAEYDSGDGFAKFIDARQVAGHPVALIRHCTRATQGSVVQCTDQDPARPREL